MNDHDVCKKIQDLEKRISKLEGMIRESSKPLPKRGKKTLSHYILELRISGFFAQAKTARETHKKLQDTYYCELNRVEVALTRLAKKKQLRKSSKNIAGKKCKAYVW
jgi:hypothetical protein